MKEEEKIYELFQIRAVLDNFEGFFHIIFV